MERTVGSVAAGLGYFVRFTLLLFQVALGAAGPLLVAYGLHLAYPPLAFVFLGLVVTTAYLFALRGKK